MKVTSHVCSGPKRTAVTASVLSLATQLAGAETVSTTLNLVSQAGFNELALSLQVPAFETGNDTSVLTGTTEVTLDIDPNDGFISQLTFTGGALTGTPITLTGNSTLFLNPGSYSFTSTTLFGTANTTNSPGPVDNVPSPGDFDATRHQIDINGGSLNGAVVSLFVNSTLNQDFAATPVAAAGAGMGYVHAFFRADLSSPAMAVYDVEVVVPVDSSSDVDSGGVIVTFGAVGQIKMAGQIQIPLPVPPPVLLTQTLQGTDIQLTWSAVSGITYRVEYNPDLSATHWFALPDDVNALGTTAGTLAPLTSTNRLYRVRIAP